VQNRKSRFGGISDFYLASDWGLEVLVSRMVHSFGVGCIGVLA
jgi:hypothetical protein